MPCHIIAAYYAMPDIFSRCALMMLMLPLLLTPLCQPYAITLPFLRLLRRLSSPRATRRHAAAATMLLRHFHA